MKVTYDSPKRQKTLQERGLDFEQALEVFSGLHFTQADNRQYYGEDRYITMGYLKNRMVIMVWTPRGDNRHIISMRKANEREITRFKHYLA